MEKLEYNETNLINFLNHVVSYLQLTSPQYLYEHTYGDKTTLLNYPGDRDWNKWQIEVIYSIQIDTQFILLRSHMYRLWDQLFNLGQNEISGLSFDPYTHNLCYSTRNFINDEARQLNDDIFALNIEEMKQEMMRCYNLQTRIKALTWQIVLCFDQTYHTNILYLANQILGSIAATNITEFIYKNNLYEILSLAENRTCVKLKGINGIWGDMINYGNKLSFFDDLSELHIKGNLGKIENLKGDVLVTNIEKGVFENLKNLEVLSLPPTLKKMDWSFWNCRKLRKIEVLSEYYKSIDGVLYTADEKTLIAYPNCWGKSYSIPIGVENIANKAFKDCQHLQQLTIPSTLKHIGTNAFYRCKNLSDIYVDQWPGNFKLEQRIGDYGKVNPMWHFKGLHMVDSELRQIIDSIA